MRVLIQNFEVGYFLCHDGRPEVLGEPRLMNDLQRADWIGVRDPF
jgi:hypothetical protein